MKTYDAILALSEKSSIREMFGEFLCISKSKDFFGNDIYEAEFEKQTLSQWRDKPSFEREIMKFLSYVSLNVMKKMGL